MVSIVETVFALPIALISVGFVVPALVMVPQKSVEFRRTASIGISDTVAQSFTSAFLNTRGNNRTNYKDASYTLSGKEMGLERELFTNPPEMFGYLKLSFNSPYDSAGTCYEVPGWTSSKEGKVLGHSCDFALTATGGRSRKVPQETFRIRIPVRGNKTGTVTTIYEVK
ncbi:MAG: hypothetical protein ABEJ36_04210 [Candidatus Nanosalina sp.]